MAMVEPTEGTTGFPFTEGAPVISLIPTTHDDPYACTFVLSDQDHTLGNALRYMIMKNPAVDFCGYTIPHPSEFKINIRIQTDGSVTASDALYKGLQDLIDLSSHVKETFKEALERKDYPQEEGVIFE